MRPDKRTFIALTGEVRNYLSFLAESGTRGFDCSKKSLDIVRSWGGEASPARKQMHASSPKPQSISSAERLETLRKDIGDCHRCKLSNGRMNIVFGAGDPDANLVFIGDAPGYDEDMSGEPFKGEAGQLLTKIIENAMKLRRDQVYICNLVKCRPPGNRDLEPDEIKACYPFLRRQVAAIAPDYICTLGTPPAQTLLRTREPVSKLRGRFHKYMGSRVMPTFHPEHLLQYPGKKRDTWEDIKILMKALGIDSQA